MSGEKKNSKLNEAFTEHTVSTYSEGVADACKVIAFAGAFGYLVNKAVSLCRRRKFEDCCKNILNHD